MRNTRNRNCKTCPFLPGSDWRGVDQAGLDSLEHGHETVHLPAGARVFCAGEPNAGVWVLTRGLVAIRRSDAEGESVIVRLVFPVRSFGLTAFLHAVSHRSTAIALTDIECCLIRRSTVDNSLQREPAVARGLLQRLAGDLAAAEEGLLALATVPVRDRLLHLLLRLLEHAQHPCPPGPDGEDHGVLDLPMSRREIAEVLAVRPETLSRVIAVTEEQGLLRIHGRHVTILDVGRVIAEVEPAV